MGFRLRFKEWVQSCLQSWSLPLPLNGSHATSKEVRLLDGWWNAPCVLFLTTGKTLNSSMASCWKRESTSIFQYESVGGSSGKRHSYALIFCMISLSEQVTVQGFPPRPRVLDSKMSQHPPVRRCSYH